MRKLNLLLAASAFAGTAMLAACGGPPPGTDTATTESTQSAVPVVPAPAPVVVMPGTPGTVTTQTSHSTSYPAQ
jgi:hypothetical protein